MERQPELHVSALSPPEYRAYTQYLDHLALAQAARGEPGLDADGKVRFARAGVRDFATDRLAVPRAIVDDALALIPGSARLPAGQVYAVFRLLSHSAAMGSPHSRTVLDAELVFLPVDPLPLDPARSPPPAPPRRAASVSKPSYRAHSRNASRQVPPRPRTPPSPPTSSAPLSLSRSASLAHRKSLPGTNSLDPFRDTPSPQSSPAKSRAYSTSSMAVGSNNPFRAGAPGMLTDLGASGKVQSAPSTANPLNSSANSVSSHTGSTSNALGASTSSRGVGPPLPPRKPSIRRPGPALPPRNNLSVPRGPPGGRVRADSLSSSSTWSDTSRHQPTRAAAPSDLIANSLAAAAAASEGARPGPKSMQVIRTYGDGLGLPSRPAAYSSYPGGSGGASPDKRSISGGTMRSVSAQSGRSTTGSPAPPPPPGRRDIVDTVKRAVRECDVDPPPPPPQRIPSASAPPPPPQRNPSVSGSVPAPPQRNPSMSHSRTVSRSNLSSSTAFSALAEETRAANPGLKTWAPSALLGDSGPAHRRGNVAMIVLNQPITRKDTLLRAWAGATVRFCADGGANRLYDALEPEERPNFLPTMIKGDLDSLRPDVKSWYAARGVPVRKDGDEYSTDLQKCITEVESIEASTGKRFTLLLFGGLSGRLDQTISILSALTKLHKTRRDTYVLSENSLAWALGPGAHLIEIDHSEMGQTCGLLPVGVTSAHVRTEGLKWDVDWDTSLDGDLSTSNHLLPENPGVFVETDQVIFWTLELRDHLPLPLGKVGGVDEIQRGVKELGVGVGKAVKGLGRRLSTRTGSSGGAERAERVLEREREREERWEREQRGERKGLVTDGYGSDEGGYAQLD